MTLSVPAVTGETQPIIRIVEVLPAPLGPRKPNDSPGATSKSMASTAVKPPNRLVRPRAWISEEGDAASRADACAGTGVSGMGRHGTPAALPSRDRAARIARPRRASFAHSTKRATMR
jgi:hypothetical protein